jgi:hypothetical protein
MNEADERPEDAPPAPAANERRRARQAELEAANEHGRQMAQRYGLEQTRPRFAALGHAGAKRRRR